MSLKSQNTDARNAVDDAQSASSTMTSVCGHSPQTDSEQVKQFTSAFTAVPDTPQPMAPDRTAFILKMILSEALELGQTVYSNEEVKQKLKDMIDSTDFVADRPKPANEDELCAEQVDAMVDIYYYMQDSMVRCGINMSDVFKIVHEANMKKVEGGVKRREDGKILKPAGWQPPNVVEEIKRQKNMGSWIKK